jgi:hypothetical protein
MAVFVIPFNFVIQEEMDEEAVKLKKALEDAEELRMAERDDELERFEAQREAGISAVAHAIQTGGPPALSRSKSGHHLKRSPSFMLRVAKSLGFDWGLLSVSSVLYYLCRQLLTRGLAAENPLQGACDLVSTVGLASHTSHRHCCLCRDGLGATGQAILSR